MLKETETKETIGFFVAILSLVTFQLGGEPFGYAFAAWWLRTSSKFGGKGFEEIHRNIESLETPKQVRIPPATK